ncbi:MAG: double-strand break repair protein AddB [Alphaproteobacteria bacterium]|nr:double-strand break repair protein AddB [Alphaproteobacteria bacterium]
MANVYTIPSGYSFLESLAVGLLRIEEEDSFRFCQMEIYLPTRRACVEIKQALIRQGQGRFLLLPKLLPLGDLDEDEELLSSPLDEFDLKPLIPPFQRLGLLTHLIEDYIQNTGLPRSSSLTLKLAKSLVKIMDQASIENVPWEGLMHLVPSEFAGHWQLTLNFLDIISTHWPRILEEKGCIEPYLRHHLLVESLTKRWERTPPEFPILAAGSTGTMPATSRLLRAIASLPQGSVILPGLDRTLSGEEAQTLSPCHPQYSLAQFLQKMNLEPQAIPLWPRLEKQEETCYARAQLFAEALKPSFSFDKEPPHKALEGVYLVPCMSPQEEALAIAILLRQQLETPKLRAVLITSDLKLAERVTWELKRWGIEIDSSSGELLEHTPSGVFLKLCAEFLVKPYDQVALLSLLKHPLFRLGHSAGVLRSEIRQFEKKCLRGDFIDVPSWLENFKSLVRPLREMTEASLEKFLMCHREIAEVLSTDEEGICQLWKGPKGEAVQAFFKSLVESSVDFPNLSLEAYPSFLTELLRGQSVRIRPQKHPRLSILGPIEARLFHADVMILGGLNEGTWPPDISMDPWLNRPMRQEMGFPPPERRIGLSAHDFGQAFSSSKVYLTRALKRDGTPTMACRWLERLEVYLKAWNLELPKESRVLEWAQGLDQSLHQKTLLPPFPSPPVHTRPRRLSVTQIETWRRDPYAHYARMILSLSPVGLLNVQVDFADRGILIHNALDQFFKVCPDPLHKKSLEVLLMIGKTLFEPYEEDASLRLFWWPRFCQLAKWFIENERIMRLPGTRTFTEVKGSLILNSSLGSFECTAKADRIDVLPDGRLRILDYKTGAPPTDEDVNLGFSPQLPLEGAIAMSQGFEGISSTEIESLQYWWLKGDSKGGVIKTLPGDPHDLSSKALRGLEHMIHVFENEKTPYPAQPTPMKGLKYNDYAHLARLQEWGRQ